MICRQKTEGVYEIKERLGAADYAAFRHRIGRLYRHADANVSGLSWLNYGQSFGLENPIVLDLGLLILTFGLTIHISIASILGVVIAIIIYRKL